MILPNQTFLDIIKTKLPRRADSIERGESVVEAKVSGDSELYPGAKKVKPGRQFGFDSPSAISKEHSEGYLVGSARRGWRGSDVFRIEEFSSRFLGSKHCPAIYWKHVIRIFTSQSVCFGTKEQSFSLCFKIPNTKYICGGNYY